MIVLLDFMNITGTIPPAFGELHALEYFSFGKLFVDAR